eukprot:1545741-Pyramimonas_sp.AAC.1
MECGTLRRCATWVPGSHPPLTRNSGKHPTVTTTIRNRTTSFTSGVRSDDTLGGMKQSSTWRYHSSSHTMLSLRYPSSGQGPPDLPGLLAVPFQAEVR